MQTFILRGLAEGLAGTDSVQAENIDALFGMFPALAAVQSKLTIEGNLIRGFAACDG
jgi:hypothetical protein